VADVLTGITGSAFTVGDIIEIGERAATLCRLVNLRAGLGVADDELPVRFHQAFTEGPLAGQRIEREQIASVRSQYYRLMGWIEDAGIPSHERLRDLEIDEEFWL
jgi:aldehyde:ferredoxin oxidoreductase